MLVEGMKRCGQWIILLWIAAVLLYPQAETTAFVARDTVCALDTRQLPAQSLVSSFNLKDSPRSEVRPSASAVDYKTACAESALRAAAPAFAWASRSSSPVIPDLSAETGRLPFAQGPPSLV